ncbi:MAG: hypothetical protein SRB2_04447 [Desulfobacteraceae bacterium Eth-SRB2]|nr:MAG: hypothetical protein SRB2_04447 [Desulfobacteraceae bacterium Eth-SRB2]
MQEKVVFDTNIYIGIFNHGLYQHEISGLNKVMYMVYPVLHELWMAAKGNAEIKHLIRFGTVFVKLGRLVQPEPSTQILIGRVCHKLRFSGKLDPKNPSDYNDVCIALLARQIGATVITRNVDDFKRINEAIGFNFRDAS